MRLFSQEVVTPAIAFADSMKTFKGHEKMVELLATVSTSKQVLTHVAALFIEMGIATSLAKGLQPDGKVVAEKVIAALANVDMMLSTKYEGVDEEGDWVHPVLLKIARDAVKP